MFVLILLILFFTIRILYFFWTYNIRGLWIFPIELGIVPVNWFEESCLQKRRKDSHNKNGWSVNKVRVFVFIMFAYFSIVFWILNVHVLKSPNISNRIGNCPCQLIVRKFSAKKKQSKMRNNKNGLNSL